MKKVILLLTIIVGLSGCQSINKDEGVESESQVVQKERTEMTANLTNTDWFNINSYLSNLSHVQFESYDKETPNHDRLLHLGYWLNVFSGMEQVSYEEVDGKPYDVFEYESFNKMINQYFDIQLEEKGNDEWLFQDNKYYHPSFPTGYNLNTVTQMDRVFDNGDGTYLIEGSIYKFEPMMESNQLDQYLRPKTTWTASMESELIGTVTATIVYSERLNQYVIDEYQANYFDNKESSNESDNQTVEETSNTESQEQDLQTETNDEWDPAWSTKADEYYEQPEEPQQQVTKNFTQEEALEYVKHHYGEDEDTIYYISSQVEYDVEGRTYYTVTLKSKSIMEAGGSGTLFFVKVYGDGTIVE